MKTLKQWEESRKPFTDWITAGDEIELELFNYFLFLLPPHKVVGHSFLMGEPYDCLDRVTRYMAFRSIGKKLFYSGIMTVKQFMEVTR